MPDDEVAQEAVAVIREAMAATETVGISRLVLSRRERAVLLQPRGKGIVLWTLRYGDELRDPDEVFGKLKEKKAESQLVTLVQKMIEDLKTPWDAAMVQDPVQERQKDIIASKRKNKSERQAKSQTEEEPKKQRTGACVVAKCKKQMSPPKSAGKEK